MQDRKNVSRRRFIATTSAGAAAAAVTGMTPGIASSNTASKLAVLGGDPVRSNKSWPEWPYWDQAVLDSVEKTTKSRIWCRIQSKNGTVPTMEKGGRK